jgi:predicted nuclease with RNAse H fold
VSRVLRAVAYVGVDVQAVRGCPYVVLEGGLKPHASGWLASPQAVAGVLPDRLASFGKVAVGIDAPRRPLEQRRLHYWNGQEWRRRRPSESGHGRHCEVVVAAFGIARPQWTPLLSACPPWMRVGFALYSALSAYGEVHEVFPTASYHQLVEDRSAQLSICLAGFRNGPKDMLDAYVAAFTVHEFLAGRGAEIGGGDGLGTIILPRPLPHGSEVLRWPGRRQRERGR